MEDDGAVPVKVVDSAGHQQQQEGAQEGGSKKVRSAMDELGDVMKSYENAYEKQLCPWEPYIIRLDGHQFSKFTQGFVKPFDQRIYMAMVYTAADCMLHLNAITAYTQSDEITLVFPAARTEPSQTKTIVYDGRVGKLATLAAGYCSVRFLYHMNRCEKDPIIETVDKQAARDFLAKQAAASGLTTPIAQEKEKETAETSNVTSTGAGAGAGAGAGEKPAYKKNKPKTYKNMTFADKIQSTYFDARAFSVPSQEQVVMSVQWRMMDVKRNSKNNLGFSHFSHKDLHKHNPGQVLERLEKERGVSWDDMPPAYKYGAIIKRERYKPESITLPSGEVHTSATLGARTRLVYGTPNLYYKPDLTPDELKREQRKQTNLIFERFFNSCPEYADMFIPLPNGIPEFSTEEYSTGV
eukprot:TRINITY_DN1802_c0_g1_i1.p1 TRINITY_DN1802_c0_g1~~TRINITY_DN1802_c0_g1_i1.p1  ORF type:complete len:410 (+),score=84.90 TRINITY_DN1802_c0_g1_i1:48-1277(+)